MIVGIIMMSKTPANIDSVVTEVSVNANAPNEAAIPKITRVVAFALLLVEIPPFRMPQAKKIKPNIIVRPVRACIPSMNVLAIPAYETTTPARPMAVRPMPGIIKSQSLICGRFKK
jgi:hypothetical protein